MKSTSTPHYKDVKAFILKETFKLVLVRNQENITVADIESAVGFTRGAIFYYMKNKKEVIEQAISSHLFSSFNPYFPINSLHINTLNQYIEAKINHLSGIYRWLEADGIHINYRNLLFPYLIPTGSLPSRIFKANVRYERERQATVGSNSHYGSGQQRS